MPMASKTPPTTKNLMTRSPMTMHMGRRVPSMCLTSARNGEMQEWKSLLQLLHRTRIQPPRSGRHHRSVLELAGRMLMWFEVRDLERSKFNWMTSPFGSDPADVLLEPHHLLAQYPSSRPADVALLLHPSYPSAHDSPFKLAAIDVSIPPLSPAPPSDA